MSHYNAYFAIPDLVSVEFDATVIDLVIAIRARHRLKNSDALRAACSLQLGRDHAFVTDDEALGRVARLDMAVLC